MDAAGIRLAEKHLNPLENLVPPVDISELRRVLGLFQASRRFIDHYAHVALPMSLLLRGRKPAFTWGPEQQASFDKIRDALLEGVHLAPPRYDLPFHLATDASDDGKGGVLYQLPGVPIDKQYPHDPILHMLLIKWPSYHSIPNAGLNLCEDGPLSIWKLMSYCGAWRKQDFTLYLRLSPFTRTLTTHL